jgi:serine/threonine protein kinase
MIEPGHRIDKYEVQRRLGRGGMGSVYLAHDTVLGRQVAIKLFLGDLDVPDARDRFIREARSAARLNHPNIVIVHEFGEFSSQPYIVMEYVVGETLAETIRRKSSASLVEKLQWMDDLCAAVSYAHDAGVIHRDIKPTNLMIDRSGRLKVLDFGVARMMGTFGTAGTSFVGTPGYMAPEQILGRTVDERSDLFSIGVVCYEVVAYREAFSGDTIPTVTHRVLHEQPSALAEISPNIDPELAAAVERALEKSMDDRFPDVAAMRQVLAGVRRRLELLGGDTLTVPASADPRRDNRATPASRQRGSSKLGSKQATPLPGSRDAQDQRHTPPRADRIQTALRDARSLLEQGDLDPALEACEKALALDDTNPEALEVERAIRAAAARRRARVLLSEVRSLIRQESVEEAQERLEQARGLNAELAECVLVESELQALRAALERRSRGRSGPHKAAVDGQPSSVDDEETVLTPPRPVTRAGAADAETVIAPPRPSAERRTPPPTPPPRRDTPPLPPPVSFWERVRKASKRVDVPSVLPRGTYQRRAVVAAAIATVVVFGIAAAIVVNLFRTPGVPPSGAVLVDAVPWGTVTAVRSADGKEHVLPSDALTPLLITLPPGSYDITVAGPGSGSASQQVRVEVAPDALASAPIVRFATVTVEDYFGQYLKPTEPASSAAGTQDTAGVPAPGVQP